MKIQAIALSAAGLCSALLLSGCGGIRVSDSAGRIKLATDPAGATAYANGNALGSTPLDIAPGEHFAAGFVGMAYRYYGQLSFKKPGCEPYVIDVNDHILSRDVHAKLKCDPDYRAPASAMPKQASPGTETYTERLERIEALHTKGLISDEEYRSLRKRILDVL